MDAFWQILGKAATGGAFVVAFALVSEVFSPKRFAGVFSAAPSAALGGLTVTLLAKGPQSPGQRRAWCWERRLSA